MQCARSARTGRCTAASGPVQRMSYGYSSRHDRRRLAGRKRPGRVIVSPIRPPMRHAWPATTGSDHHRFRLERATPGTRRAESPMPTPTSARDPARALRTGSRRSSPVMEQELTVPARLRFTTVRSRSIVSASEQATRDGQPNTGVKRMSESRSSCRDRASQRRQVLGQPCMTTVVEPGLRLHVDTADAGGSSRALTRAAGRARRAPLAGRAAPRSSVPGAATPAACTAPSAGRTSGAARSRSGCRPS